MDALLVVDMQAGLLAGTPKRDVTSVVERIAGLATQVRARGGTVCFIQHAGPAGDLFEPGTPGWELLGDLHREPGDLVVRKTLNDPFFETELAAALDRLAVTRVLVTGWATDLCVDATVRSAAARGYAVTAVADSHTVSDRPHMSAGQVITHHHWVWTNLLARHAVQVTPAADLFPTPKVALAAKR